MPDSSTRISSDAISVNPCELCFPDPMVSPAPKALLVAIAKCHIARADVGRQIHALGLVAAVDDALPHHYQVDLLDVVGGFASADGVSLIGVERVGRRVVNVKSVLQIDNVIRHRLRSKPVDLAHQSRSLASR